MEECGPRTNYISTFVVKISLATKKARQLSKNISCSRMAPNIEIAVGPSIIYQTWNMSSIAFVKVCGFFQIMFR